MTNRLIYFVVGDKKLDSGNGIYAENLEEMKKRLLNMAPSGKWRLVISMHGAQDVIATRGGYLKDPNAKKGVYHADDIKKLFGDETFKKWRDKSGPSWTTLASCQVVKPFEKVILESLNKPDTEQEAQGLGEDCRPNTEVRYFEFSFDGHKFVQIKTRQQWTKIPAIGKEKIKAWLTELNKNFGYFGGPPIDESLLLDYYFDEEPKGGWPVVTISVNHEDTGWSFYNRTSNARFLTTCEHLGPLLPEKTEIEIKILNR